MSDQEPTWAHDPYCNTDHTAGKTPCPPPRTPSTRTRDELLRMKLEADALSNAAEAELKRRARQLWEVERSADTWRLPLGQVQTALTHDRAAIKDREAFLAWLANAVPHQVKVEVIEVRTVINERWLVEEYLPTLLPMDPEETDPGEQTLLSTADGELVPGVAWLKGGTLHQVSIVGDKTVQRSLRLGATAYIEGSGPWPLPNGSEETRG